MRENMTGFRKGFILAVNGLFLTLFLPVLFCVGLIGNDMDYNDGMKLNTLLPGRVLFVLALAGTACCIALFGICRKITLTRKGNAVTNGVLALGFTALYFVNVWVAKEIAFLAPWDVRVVRSIAYAIADGTKLGDLYYLSMYPNNIPISYFLEKLLRKARELDAYSGSPELIWLQACCASISIGGMFSCLTVKKITKNPVPTAAAFMIYLVLAGMSPWKVIPYTDTLGAAFAVMSVYFYICKQKTEREGLKYIYMVLAVGGAVFGGLIKPSIYIVLIAIIAIEFLHWIEGWRVAVAGILLAVGFLAASEAYKGHMIEESGLDFNPEIEANWQSYFYMGLNEESTGAYSSDDASIIGEFQFSKDERNQAALERAAGRLRERGFFGTLRFWLRKMTMTFNDGMFGWASEVWIDEPFPDDIAQNTVWTLRLRSVFWPEGSRSGLYYTICQLVWMFCILGIPGVCVGSAEKREEHGLLTVCCTGIFLYQMLFEARARYLFVFLPLLIAAAVCGMGQYELLVRGWLKKRKGCGTADG